MWKYPTAYTLVHLLVSVHTALNRDIKVIVHLKYLYSLQQFVCILYKCCQITYLLKYLEGVEEVVANICLCDSFLIVLYFLIN